MRTTAAIVVLVGSVSSLGGCVSDAEIREVRDAAAQLAQRLDGPAGRELAAGVANLDEALTGTDQSRIEGAARSLAPFVPAPAQGPLLLALGLAAGMTRAGQLKRALASVARGIENAKTEDQGFREAFDRSVGQFRATQTPTARRIVDETKRERFMVRLPV